MRDRDGGSALGGLVQCLLHYLLALGVERAGCLVQEENHRVADQGARDGDALALPARQSQSSGPCLGVIAFGEGLDEGVDVGGSTGIYESLLRNIVIHAEEYVLPQRTLVQGCVLRDKSHVAPIRFHVQGREVLAMNENLARFDVVEPLEQGDDGRLPASRRTDDTDSLAMTDCQIEFAEDRDIRTGWVGKAHVAEFDCRDIFFGGCMRGHRRASGTVDWGFLFPKV